MARDHGRISVTIWNDKDFRDRSPEAQRLYLLLLSQRNVNNAGILPLQIGKWAKCSTITAVEDIEDALSELVEYRYVLVDPDTEEAFIRSFIRNDGIVKNANVFKNALRCAEMIESPELRLEAAAELRRIGRRDASETAEKLAPLNGVQTASERRSESSEPPSDGERRSNGVGTVAGRGKGKSFNSSTSRITSSERNARAKPQTAIPDDWAPNEMHASKARQMNADLNHEADRFRNHALANDRKQADWGAAFHMWLGHAKPSAPGGRTFTRREQTFIEAESLKSNPHASVLQHFDANSQKAIGNGT